MKKSGSSQGKAHNDKEEVKLVKTQNIPISKKQYEFYMKPYNTQYTNNTLGSVGKIR